MYILNEIEKWIGHEYLIDPVLIPKKTIENESRQAISNAIVFFYEIF